MPIRLAQTIGLTTAGALTGASFAITGFVVPRILESPSPLLLTQWKHCYEAGKAGMPPITGICALSFWYLAYEAKRTPHTMPHQWKMYLISGLIAISIVPYTALFVAPINKKLLKKAEETSTLAAGDKIVEVGLGGESAHQLVDKWATLNLGRTVLLAVAAVLGTWTALE